MARAKNVLWIMCDQLRYDYLGCTGHPTLKTPNIDAMARRGVLFTKAYVQSPICGPPSTLSMQAWSPSSRPSSRTCCMPIAGSAVTAAAVSTTEPEWGQTPFRNEPRAADQNLNGV